MTEIWRGAARPLSPGVYDDAARMLGCEVAAIRAVAQVESAGGGFLRDGSVVRRFEPHQMPGATTDWRQSLRIGAAERERMFLAAYEAAPDAALRATSWGRFQIMGFNCVAAGFPSAAAMVAAMAEAEDEHVAAFIGFVRDAGLAQKIRDLDFAGFARVYNGPGRAQEYAERMRDAYRNFGGAGPRQTLRVGSGGTAVKDLQHLLGVRPDGSFGPQTRAAVARVQTENGLAADGIVGPATWAVLRP